MRRVDAALRKRRGGNLAGDPLAEAGNIVRGARRQFAHGNNAAEKIVQRVELGFQDGMNFREAMRSQKLGSGAEVPFASSA